MLQVLQNNFFLSLTYLTILATTLIFFIYKFFSSKTLKNSNGNNNSPPSPPSFPIIGNLHQLGSDPHRALQTLSRRYGPDLMLLRLGRVPVVVVSSARAAREIMKTHDLTFSDRPKGTSLEKLLYNYRDVSSSPYGEYWRQAKSICVLHLLSNKRIRSFQSVREEEVKLMMDKIRWSFSGSSSNPAVDFREIFVRLTNNVVCRATLGRKFDETERGKRFKALLVEFIELLGGFVVGDYIPMLWWLTRVNGLEARMDRVAKEIDEFLEGIVEEHMESSVGADDRVGNENEQKNFVDILLWIQRENLLGFPIDRTCIKALLLDMFAAGTDTTSTLLEWAMTELMIHPNAMKVLQNEVRTIVGEEALVTEDDLDKMPYLKAVFKETLRLHPPIPLLVPRVSTRDAKVLEYDVVSGSQVFVNVWAIGRDSATWVDPDEFRPERFLDSTVDYKGHNFGLIPFGAGRRGCPGIQFATTVNEIALANIVHGFDWSLPCSDLDMTETVGFTLRRKFPLMALPKLAR